MKITSVEAPRQYPQEPEKVTARGQFALERVPPEVLRQQQGTERLLLLLVKPEEQ
jgi:hypothetical protein